MEIITAGQSPHVFRAFEDNEGQWGVWHQERTAKGLAKAVTGEVYYLGSGYTTWGFTAKAASREEAEALASAMEWDAENPS